MLYSKNWIYWRFLKTFLTALTQVFKMLLLNADWCGVRNDCPKMGVNMRKCIFVAFLVLPMLFSSCTAGKRISLDINHDWKRSMQDDARFSAPDFDDSKWENVSKPAPADFGTVDNHYFWVRKTVDIPSDLRGEDVYLGFGKVNCAVEVYADGVFIGTRGTMPPDTNIRIEETLDILIPKSCIRNDSVNIALRIYTCETDVDDMRLTLDNGSQAYFQNVIHNIFNQRIFVLMAAVCLFMSIYCFSQYISSRDIAYLMFSISTLFVLYYFYDLGGDICLINYNVHRSLTRASLPISIGFLALFLASFFKRNYFKKMLPAVVGFCVLVLLLFMINCGKHAALSKLFTVMLIPVFGVIVYGYFVIIRAAKKRQFGSINLMIGFIGGSIFATFDIVVQISGTIPFMWMQGIAFFAIDMAIFSALARRDGSNQRHIARLAKQTVEQKDRLSEVFENAKSVASETSEISHSLADSVVAVNDAVDSTQNKVEEIKKALDVQGRSQEETAKSVANLTNFLDAMSQQFDKQSKLIESTASRINDVIQGIQNVGEGVTSAAEFSRGLSGITSSSSGDMRKLLEEMQNVQDSSKEILGVVTTLDTFAQQTNLLAMNASIEAAHSGEFGKGFAVIAREIKDFASQTSQWSAKIGEIITVVISQIQHSVELCTKVNGSLSKINVDSQESAQKVGAASQSVLAQREAGEIIARESADLATLAKKMRDSLVEQKEFADNVNRNIDSLFKAAKEVDLASREIYNETKVLSDESRNLRTLALRTNESSESLTTIMTQNGK